MSAIKPTYDADMMENMEQLDFEDNVGSENQGGVQESRRNRSQPHWRRRVSTSTEPSDMERWETKFGLSDGYGRTRLPTGMEPSRIGSVVVAAIVIANMLAIGIEIDVGHIQRASLTWSGLDAMFAFIFFIELVGRIVINGLTQPFYPKYFVAALPPEPLNRSREDNGRVLGALKEISSWFMWICYIRIFNTLDAIIIICRLIDFTLTVSEQGEDAPACADDPTLPCSICICRSNGRLFLKLITTLRVLRVGFAVKQYRLVRNLRELWLIMAGLADTIKTILWVLLLLILVLWVFSIFMVASITRSDTLKDYVYYGESPWSLEDYWGSAAKCLFTLFEVLTMDKWSHSIAWPLVRKYPGFIIPFVFFLSITVVCLLNLITGVVVEVTLTSAKANAEREGQEMQRTYKRVTESLEQLFKDADEDGNGGIDRDELDIMMRRRKVRDRLRMLDIPVGEMVRLFHLLDDNKEGCIPIEKFFRGTARLRGPAMACDLNQMSVDLHRHISTTKDFSETMVENNSTLNRLCDKIDTVDREIIRGDDDDRDPVLKARRGRARFSAAKRQAAMLQALQASSDESDGRVGSKRKSSLVRHALRSDRNEEKRNPSKMSTTSSKSRNSKTMQAKLGFQWGTEFPT